MFVDASRDGGPILNHPNSIFIGNVLFFISVFQSFYVKHLQKLLNICMILAQQDVMEVGTAGYDVWKKRHLQIQLQQEHLECLLQHIECIFDDATSLAYFFVKQGICYRHILMSPMWDH